MELGVSRGVEVRAGRRRLTIEFCGHVCIHSVSACVDSALPQRCFAATRATFESALLMEATIMPRIVSELLS